MFASRFRIFALAVGLAFAMCSLATPAAAAEIPSDISADYYGDGYACTVHAYLVQAPLSHGLEFECELPNRDQTSATTTTYGCSSNYTLVPLPAWGSGGVRPSEKSTFTWVSENGAVNTTTFRGDLKSSTHWIRIDAYVLGAGIAVRVGSFAELSGSNNGGVAMRWDFAQYRPSAVPYPGCGAPPLPQPPPTRAGLTCTWLGCF